MWKLVKVVKFAVIGTAFVAAFGALTMYLWNALIPDLFHGPVLNFWQACGLIVLSHILFRGGGFKHGGGWHHRKWKQGFEAKLAAMTPEEREKFISRWDHWACCHWGPEKATTPEKPVQA
ncbi:MAG: hypothetical protein U1F16_12465 [Turneriella sp.]